MRPSDFRLLALAPNPWQGPWMNRQHLLSRLGKKHAILYSQGQWNIWDRGEPEWRAGSWRGGFEQSDGIVIDSAPKLLLRWPSFALLDHGVLRLGAARWRRKLQRMGGGPLVAHLFHPMFWPQLEALRADFVVYHAYDMHSKTPGWTQELDTFEKKLLQRADLLIASSQQTSRELSRNSAREVRFLPNGADYDAFAGAAESVFEPPSLASIPHPRIGYTGNINRKVDLPLILRLASAHPQWHFVLIGALGNLDAVTSGAMTGLAQLANVHLLGPIHPRELPAYVSGMDVNIMSYRISPELWTEWIYPLKLHEYLAAGRPVVAANLPSLQAFANVVRLANDAAEWELALGEAVAGRGAGSKAERQAVARQNTWDDRVELLDRWLTDMVRPGR
jgi:glycosyltransferase involved in cell wall biosynthesis